MNNGAKSSLSVLLCALLCMAMLPGMAGAASLKILEQPENASVMVGDTVTFSVLAQGDNLDYQWQSRAKTQKHYIDIDGANEASYTTGKLKAADNHTRFRCAVSNTKKTLFTDSVNLIVRGDAITITKQPQAQKASAGEKATFSVTAEGEGLTYQWQKRLPSGKSYTAIEGATGASYTTPALKTADNRTRFLCAITDKSGHTQLSNSVNLAVSAAEKPAASVKITVTQEVHFNPNSDGTVPAQVIYADLKANVLASRNVKWEILGASSSKFKLVSAPIAGSEVKQGENSALWTVYIVPVSKVTADDAVTVKVTSVADPSASASCSVNVHTAVVNNHTLTFYAPDATTAYAPHTLTVPDKGFAGLPETPVRNGYAFGGWFTGQNGTGIQLASNLSITTDMIFYAKWNLLASYQITLDYAFDNNREVMYYEAGSAFDLSGPSIDRPGYSFVGWYTARNGGKRVFSIVPSDVGNKTFYAHWEKQAQASMHIDVKPYTVELLYGTEGYATLTLTSKNVEPGTAVYLTVSGGFALDTVLYTDYRGEASTTIVVPGDTPDGVYSVSAQLSSDTSVTAYDTYGVQLIYYY